MNQITEDYPKCLKSWSQCTVLSVLQRTTRLAKASTCRLPDYDGMVGLDGIGKAMRFRAAILEAVSNMEWAQKAFVADDASDLDEFDQGMVVRMELLPFGLELDREELVNIV